MAAATLHPERVRALTIVSGACPLTDAERAGLVRANAELGTALAGGWDTVHDYLAELARQLLDGGIASAVTDAAEADGRRRLVGDHRERDRANRREALAIRPRVPTFPEPARLPRREYLPAA